MLQSMTAFARSEKHTADCEIVTEIRSYNSKNLDLLVRLPHFGQPLEERIKSMAGSRLHRGRVEIRMEIREVGEGFRRFEIDLPKARAYHQAVQKLKSELRLEGAIDLETMLVSGGIIKPAEDEKDLEGLWELMAAGLAANLTVNPLKAVTTVTVQIVTLLVGDQEFDSAKTLAAFALGLLLFVVTLILNVIALHVVRKYREQYE